MENGSASHVDEPSALGLTSSENPAPSSINSCNSWQLATWGFVVLAILLRLVRYLMNQPLWGDEAFVSVNLIQRGYRELLLPLDFGQICPWLFLWAELTCVKLFGFQEWSLRLFPFLCSLAAVFLFRDLASRIFRGLPYFAAVVIFAVSFHPIRHGAESKPYASDMLASLILTSLVLRWWRDPKQRGWLWALAFLTPLALLTSYPVVFIAGGIGLALIPLVLRSRDLAAYVAFATYGVLLVATFAALTTTSMPIHSKIVMPALRTYWSESFPPLDSLTGFLRWLIVTHTGSMFAYPGGGRNFASTPTFLLFALGVVLVWKRRMRFVSVLLLSPFLLTLIAAALRRYPYGGEARIAQYLVPAICLFTGYGIGAILGLVSNPRLSQHVVRVFSLAMIVVGIAPLACDSAHPYRFLKDQVQREFARKFWPEGTQGAEVACFRWDFGIINRRSMNYTTALYLCNQRIYSPQRQAKESPDWEKVSNTHPLRCVLNSDIPEDYPAVVVQLKLLHQRYDLKRRQVIQLVPPGTKRSTTPPERMIVYDFVPKHDMASQTKASALEAKTVR